MDTVFSALPLYATNKNAANFLQSQQLLFVMDPTFPLVPIANFLGFCLILLCIYGSSLTSWNTGVHMYAIWVALECLIRGINCIIWYGNVRDVAPIWCDITTHIDIAAGVAIPACSLVITRRIYRIARLRTDVRSEREDRKNLIFDLSLCFGLPAISMGLYYVVQASRYQIFEDVGCTNANSRSGLTILLLPIWGIILPIISITLYCPKIIWTFYHQRKAVNEFLDSGTGIGRVKYYRVMLLGCADAIIVLPLNTAGTLLAAFQQQLQFWPGWHEVHKHFFVIPRIREKVLEASGTALVISIRWTEWLYVFLAVIFFLLFGLTDEACRRYGTALRPFQRLFGRKTGKEGEVSKIVFKSFDIPTIPPTSPMSIYYSSAVHAKHQSVPASTLSQENDVEKGEIISISTKGDVSFLVKEPQVHVTADPQSEELVHPTRHSADVPQPAIGNRF